MTDKPRIIGREELGSGKFLCLNSLSWIDDKGTERQWEAANRKRFNGAVLIFARLRPSDRLVIIRQFRPPTERFVYELPAGLIDEGEDAATAAKRELHEETGFTASKVEVFPPAYNTPGMSDESVYMVRAEIDETAAENQQQNRHTEFDPSENIETMLIEHNCFFDFYHAETAAGNAFDAKLVAYFFALQQ